MKKFFTLACTLVALTGYAQQLQEGPSIPYQATQKEFKRNPNVTQPKTAACMDTNQYADFKTSGFRTISVNSASSAQAVQQYYNAPGNITIHGLGFYGWKADATGGATITLAVNVYNAGADSLPAGPPIATTNVTIDTSFGGGNLAVLYREATFSTPITVSSDYLIEVRNASPNSIILVCNDYSANDGAGEYLSNLDIASNFLRGYEVNVGGAPFDADWYFEPHVSYNFTSSFNKDKTCITLGDSVIVTETADAVLQDRMYNRASTFGVLPLSYAYDFGDGNGVYAFPGDAHTYAAAGAYEITLYDTLYTWTGVCVDSSSQMVSVGLAASVGASNDPTCNGGSNGTITVSGSGGASPYMFSADGSTYGTTNPLTGFSAGSQTVYVQDNLGCVQNTTTTLSEPTAVLIDSQSSTDAACGGSDGTITFSATGGTGTIEYSIDGTNYQASGSFTGLGANTYTIYARDANSCVTTSTETIANVGAPTISSASGTDVSCNGGADGTLTVSASGGSGTLEYSIDGTNFSSTTSFTGLSAATYTVTVRDTAGCSATQNVVISQPAAITANAGADQSVCANNAMANLSGSITVASGYSWSSAGGGTFSSTTAQNPTYMPSASEITAGTATITLTTTGNGSCSADSDDMIITITPAPTADAGADMTICENNSIINLSGLVTVASGGTWTTDNASASFGNANSLTSSYNANGVVGTDTLTLTTTGNGNCAPVSDEMVITVTAAPTVTASAVDSACAGDTISLTATVNGASGVVWTTSGFGTVINGSSLTASYVVSADDTSGVALVLTATSTGNGNCAAVNDIEAISVSVADPIDLGADTTVCSETTTSVTLDAGPGHMAHSWSTNETTREIGVTTSGTYSVTITDVNGCNASDDIVVTFQICDSSSIGVEEALVSWVKLYPNPTTGVVNLEVSIDDVTSLEVLNIIGEVVDSRTINATQNIVRVDLSAEDNGVYFFRFMKGNEVVTKQINLIR